MLKIASSEACLFCFVSFIFTSSFSMEGRPYILSVTSHAWYKSS